MSAGFQDNNFASTTTQIADSWQLFGGGDGVQIRVHGGTRVQTYSSQYGGLNITSNGIASTDRKGWKCPIRLDPIKPSIRYFGTNKLYKYDTAQSKWNAISGDLTNGSGGGVYGTISAFAISPTNNQYIYTGSDDGRAYITKNGGSTWTDVSAGLPGFWCTFIKVDRVNPEIAYIGFSGYRYGFTDAHFYRTVNGGTTWERISNDLPQIPVNDLETDPLNANVLYLATDIGVYYSLNKGKNWNRLGTQMPAVVTLGLNFAVNSRTLYAGTYGRGIYRIKLPAKPPTSNQKKADENFIVQVYPQPASSYFYLSIKPHKMPIDVEIQNTMGITVYHTVIDENKNTIKVECSKWNNGLYIMQLKHDDYTETKNILLKN